MSYANIIFARLNSFAQATIRNSKVLLRKKASLHVPLVISFAECNENKVKKSPIKFSEQPLSHKHLIQQACVVSVNSATQLLTQTLVAVIDTGDEYRKAMEELLLLLDESLEQAMYGVNQSELNDLIVVARSRVDELKKSLMQLNSLMEYVEKYVSSTAEAAFMAGAETVCNAMSDRLHAALQELSIDREKIKKLEEECLQLQKSLVEAEEKKKKDKSTG